MSDPILELLAAPPNPPMSVDETSVYAGGRRRLRRRRLFTAAGAAAAALAVAGTIGVLAPRVDDDALPALPTPTVTPTPEVTPTITSSASPSATVTSSASVTATPTSPSVSTTKTSTPRSTPSRVPSNTPSPTTTPITEPEWSEPVSVGGTNYRMRIAWQTVISDGERLYYAELDSEAPGGYNSLTANPDDPKKKEIVIADQDNLVLLTNWPVVDVITENDEAVEGERYGRFSLRHPDTGQLLDYVVISMPEPVTQSAPLVPRSLQVKLADGTVIKLEDGAVTR